MCSRKEKTFIDHHKGAYLLFTDVQTFFFSYFIRRAMTATSHELEQLKQKLLSQYKDEMARLSSPPSATASPENSTKESHVEPALPTSFPSTSSLTLQLLCLREGRSIHDVPTSAREQVAMMARAMPTPDVLVEDRLRHAQAESVRLLVKRTAAVMSPTAADAEKNNADSIGAKDAAHQPGKHVSTETSVDAGGAKPFTAAERLQLLEKMYASNVQALADMESPEASVAASV